jgi:hypothetical protein
LTPRRDDGVGLGKSPQRDVVPACVVEHQAEVCGVGVLSRVSILRQRRYTRPDRSHALLALHPTSRGHGI